MRKFAPLKGFDFQQFATYQEITDFLLDTKCDTHEIGLSSGGDMIYGLSIGDLNKPMIVLDGVMHGAHEWRCMHWVKEFMEIIANPPNDENKPLIERLKARFCFFAVPCLNTYGYLNNSYVNANGVNLNRNWAHGWDSYQTTEPFHSQYKGTAPMSEPESKVIEKLINDYKVISYVNTHTWGTNLGGIFETASSTKEYWTMQEDIRDSLAFTLGNNGITFRTRSSPSTPWVNEWVGTQSSKMGKKVVAFLYESGGGGTTYDQSKMGMNALFIICNYMYEWFESRKLILTD